MNRYQFISVFFIALLLFVVYQIFLVLSPFITPLFWAAILSFAFYPVYEKLKQALGQREILSAGVMTFFVLLCFVPLTLLFVMNLVEETARFINWFGSWIRNGGFSNFIQETLMQWAFLERFLSEVNWDVAVRNFQETISGSATVLGKFVAGRVTDLTKNIFVLFYNLIFTLLFLFFFFKDGEKAVEFIYEITPLEDENKRDIFDSIHSAFTAVIHGKLFTAFIQAVLTGLTFSVMNLPFPVLVSFLVFFFSLIPMIGAPLIWFPMVLILIFQQEYLRAAVLAGMGSLVIGSVDNVIYPFLIGKRMKLPYLLLFLGIFGGLQIYGLLGIFIGPTLMSLFFILIKIYRTKYIGGWPQQRRFVFKKGA